MFDFLYIQVTVITAATSSYCQGLLLYSCQKIGIWWIFDWFKKESNLIALLELVVKFHLIFHYNELTNVFVEPDCLIATFSRVSVGNLMISFKLTLWRCIFLKTVLTLRKNICHYYGLSLLWNWVSSIEEVTSCNKWIAPATYLN